MYIIGQMLMFPALQLAAGTVVGVRPGHNPDHGEFDVIAVDFGHGRPAREFAARFADHKLNEPVRPAGEEVKSPEALFAEYGREIGEKLEARLKANADIVRIAGRWFPRALLATIHIGHLNLAEAVLDMAGGGPLPTSSLMEQLELPENVNPRLLEFSMDLALQEDGRLDEVGASG